LADILQPGQSSVGTQVSVEHTAASPLGAIITATATITSAEKRKVTFDILAKDNKKEIGKGTHTRVILDEERFMSGVIL
jgi:predicted thioesterase